ncbi:phosphate-binding protein PstS precursor [bacterium BMS3Bbin12]|nr:phosphate-binding protein PstS precursor [bacterium BMS3Bbin12]GBE50761.1 phosphate-binding protein PstS precursor [bacterium BMS3Bbin13]
MSRRLKGLFRGVVLCALGAVAGAAVAGGGTEISGAGATFPYPIYAKWAEAYYKATGVRFNYQSIGSGGGIKQIKARTVDFGASDAPMKPADLDRYGLIQWPQIMGGVVAVVNVPGVKAGELKLPNAVLADIFLGTVKRWNDPAIRSVNAGVELPDKPITVVHRADGSGTTFIFTNYLSKVSPAWKAKVGFGKAVAWPAGVGGKGNEGVASYVRRIRYSIGYVEYAYALQNHMAYVRLRNRAGRYVSPNSKTFQAAAANADWKDAPGYYLILTDQPGAGSWPITGASFILVYKTQSKPEVARQVLKFFDWSYRHGLKMAERLDYVPMPAKVVRMVEGTWAREIKDRSGNPVWTLH